MLNRRDFLKKVGLSLLSAAGLIVFSKQQSHSQLFIPSRSIPDGTVSYDKKVDDRDHEKLPSRYLDYGVAVYQKTGEKLSFKIRYDADNEQTVEIFNFKTGTRLDTGGPINNYFGNIKSYVTPVNALPETMVYIVFSYHKRTRPDSHSSWYVSPYKLLVNDASTKIIGFDDGGNDKDGDYNDTVVEVEALGES